MSVGLSYEDTGASSLHASTHVRELLNYAYKNFFGFQCLQSDLNTYISTGSLPIRLFFPQSLCNVSPRRLVLAKLPTSASLRHTLPLFIIWISIITDIGFVVGKRGRHKCIREVGGKGPMDASTGPEFLYGKHKYQCVRELCVG